MIKYSVQLGLSTVPGIGTAVQKTALGQVDNRVGRAGCINISEAGWDGDGPKTAVYGRVRVNHMTYMHN